MLWKTNELTIEDLDEILFDDGALPEGAEIQEEVFGCIGQFQELGLVWS